jgi:hypothetical protein
MSGLLWSAQVPASDPEPSTADRAAATEHARRAARYKFAQDRIRKIVAGLPPLTDEQLSKLAVLLQPERTP